MNPRTLSFLFTAAAATCLLLGGCAAVPFCTTIQSALANLDAGRTETTRELLVEAEGTAENDREWALSVALQVDAELGDGNLERAREQAERLQAQCPNAFLTWKTQAVLALRAGSHAEAQSSLQAARRFALGDGEHLWLADFARLLEALAAFHTGDLQGALQRVEPIRHPDLAPAAAWLRARATVIQDLQQQKTSAARRQGLEDGLLDLLSRAGRSADRRQLVEVVHGVHARELFGFEVPEGDIPPPRARFFTSPVSVAGVAAHARVAGVPPCTLRHDG